MPPVRGPTDKTLLSLPLADYQSDSDSDTDAVAATTATILRIVNKKSNNDKVDTDDGVNTIMESGVDALKNRLLRFSMQKSSDDKDGLSHSQPEEAVEEVDEVDDDEEESGEFEEGEEIAEDGAVVMEEDDDDESVIENESDKVEEGDDDGDDDNEEEVIELDTESAGLFAAFAALRGQNTEVLKTLLGNFPLPSNGTNC